MEKEEKKAQKRKKPKRYEKRKDGFWYCLICGHYRNLERAKIRAHVKLHGR